jgi:hypothetical protein
MSIYDYQENISDEYFPPRPPPLRRTHKAYCPHCGGISESYDPRERSVPCYYCVQINIPMIQRNVRGFIVRNKLKKLKRKEAIYEWFFTKNVSGVDLSNKICSFL